MLDKICSWLEHSSSKVAPEISLREIFGDDFDYLSQNYLNSLDEFAQRITFSDSIYKLTSVEDKSVFYVECDTYEPREFTKAEARLWQFDVPKFVSEITKNLKCNITPVKLGNFTDGYCLGTLEIDHKYAIFLCFGENNFQVSASGFLRDDIRPMLIKIQHQALPEFISDFIMEQGGVEFHISELFKMSADRGLKGGDVKALLGFKGTRQNQRFNLEDLKRKMKSKNWSDLEIKIIEKSKINFSIDSFSMTKKNSDIPEFFDSRQKCPKKCWNTLYQFSVSKKEHMLRYSPYMKNRLKELRLFFNKLKNEDPFELVRNRNYENKKDGAVYTMESKKNRTQYRSRGVRETHVYPIFRIKNIEENYKIRDNQ